MKTTLSDDSRLKRELYRAVMADNPLAIEAAVQEGADIGLFREINILNTLIYQKKFSAAKTLVRLGLEVNSQAGEAGMSPLMSAAQAGNEELVRLLLDHGADVSATQKEMGWGVLQFAARSGNVEIIKIVVALGGDVNKKSKSGVTPLMSAASQGHLEAVELLVELGADLNAKASDKRTALRLAVMKERGDVVTWLRGMGAEEPALNRFDRLRDKLAQEMSKRTRALLKLKSDPRL